jgi:thiol-disulfide isomerase/thioredoxin
MRSSAYAGWALCVVAVLGTPLGAAPEGGQGALTVVFDLVVNDARGRPVSDLTVEEIVVAQDGVRQRISKLAMKSRPGHYELSYVPASGKAGAVGVQLLRPGTYARGLDGPGLKPRVVVPPSPLVSELTRILETRPEADDFRSRAAVLRFEAAPDGVHHTLAVEVPIAGLTPAQESGQYLARVQILARLSDAEGRVLHQFEVDRSVSAASPTQLRVQRLVLTGQAHLRSGRYVLDTVARDPETAQVSVQHIPFEVVDPEPGLRISSVALLHPTDGLVVRDQGHEADDPFLLGGEPLMPTLELETVAAPGVKVEFFAIVYPDRTSPERVTLRLDLVRDGNIVASAPLALPTPDDRGEIRYAGGMATRTLRPAEYKLRLLAQQGTAATYEEVPFTVGAGSEASPVRLAASISAGPAATGALDPASALPTLPELAEAQAFLRRQQYDEAIRALQKADKATNGSRADVTLLLASAYYRLGAYKDAELTARRAVELAKGTPTLAEAYVVLGRALAAGERKPVRTDSERLRAAEEAFRQAVAVSDPQAEGGQLALAETLFRLDRVEEGRELLSGFLRRPGVSEESAARAQQLLQSPRCAMEDCLPPLSFVTPDGRHCTSEELRGKVVLLSFWATWCKPCIDAVPELRRLYTKYEKEPFVMVGVNLDHDRATATKFVEANGMGWPQVTDESSARLGNAAAAQVTIPMEILFDHEGVVVARSTGWGPQSGRALFMSVQAAVDKAKKAQKKAQAPSS